MPGQIHRWTIAAVSAGCLLLQGGCNSYGPKSLPRDQLDYGRSIGDTWKNQMLANLVKLRYLDMPVFVDVGQIVSGYTIETKVAANLGFNNSLVGGDSQILGAEGRYTDRPTITYTPKIGEEYLRSLLEPVAPSALLSLVQADYNAEVLFTWAVESINGLQNFSTRKGDTHAADAEFIEFARLMSELQDIGAVGFELEQDPASGNDMVLFFTDKNISDAARSMQQRARQLIGLADRKSKFRVRYAPFAISDDTLAIQTRSVIQMLLAMSKFIDVPTGKVSRAVPGYILPENVRRPFRVHTSIDHPTDAFASIRYHGDWYWIDHDDLITKRVFVLMLFLTTLTNRASDENQPVLTIPTN